MKKTLNVSRKVLSVFLAILMVLTSWVWLPGEHNHASAKSDTINLSGLAAIYNGSGSRADSSKIVICSDGEPGNTTVGNAKFPISSLPNTVTKATLYVNTGNHGGKLVEKASVKVFVINPSKNQSTRVGHAENNIANVYGSNYSEKQGVTNAYNYYGVTESQALTTLYQNITGSHNVDITNAVNQAKANGWSDLCLAFIMPAIYKDTSDETWSDTHINSSGTYLAVEYDGAYGMPSGTRQDGTITFNREGTTTVNYPTALYMDISEDLADTGYSWKFTSDTGARVIFFPTLWGGQESNSSGTFENDRSNYDANLKGQNTIINAFDKYGLQLTGPGNYDNWTIDKEYTCVILVGNGNNNLSGGANYTLQGKPKSTGTYSFTMPDYYNSNGGDPLLFVSNSGNTIYKSNSGYSGTVNFTITVYNKEALNTLVQKNYQIYDLNKTYGDYIKEGLEYYQTQKSDAETLLKTREVTQSAINNQVTALENAIKGLKFYAENSHLKNAVAVAEAIMNETGYTAKYTEATRTALESALSAAKNGTYYPNVPVYQITNLNDNSTWDCDDKALADQLKINELATNLENAINAMGLQSYTVTFNFANGTSDVQTYDYGTTITAPSNSTKQSDATNHYTYTWTPSVATTVTGDATYNEVLETNEHNWGDWITTVYPNCEYEGSKYRTCEVCGYKENGVVEKEAHTLVHVDAKAPTCTVDGTIEYWYCSECSKMFSDADAKTEITSVVDKAKGHTYGDAATCTAPQICTVCYTELAPKLAHTEEIIPAVEATCTVSGKTAGKKCSVCDTVLEEPQDTGLAPHTEATREEVISEATCGKDGSYNVVTYCSVCNEVIRTETKTSPATGKHTLGDWIVDKGATCVTPGSQHKECEDCDYIKTETIPATGVHAYGEWSQYLGGDTHRRNCANCDAFEEGAHNFNGEVRKLDGAEYHDYKCDKCEAYGVGTRMNYREACYGEGTIYALIEGNASEHTVICKCSREKTSGHSFEVVGTPVTPDCDTDGSQDKKCTACSYEYTETLSATGHSYKAVVTDPTCTAEGYTTHTCSKCGDEYVDTYVDALGHTPAEAVKEKEVPSTCTVAGSYDSVVYCSVCNVEISRKEVEIPINAAAHTGTATVVKNDKAATCTAEGYTGDIHWSCCGALETKGTAIAIDKDAHTTEETYVDGYVAPTCTTPGATGDTKYKCCNAVKVASTEIPVNASAHTGEANVVKNKKAATCTEEGYTGDTYWSCCGALETMGTAIAIDKDAHTTEETYVDGYVAPTCTTPGATGDTKYKCCNAVKVASTEIPVLKHSYNNVVTDPTCTAQGYTTYTCTLCGDTYVSDYVDATGHSYDEEVTTEPGCTTAGVKTFTCSCGDTYTEVIDPLNHIDENPVDGKCDRCGADICKHDSKEYTAFVAATCMADGNIEYWTCTVCGKDFSDEACTSLVATVVIPKDENAHDWGEWTQTKAPTCSAEGQDTRICKYNSEHKDYRSVVTNPAAHTLVQVEAKAPTCTEPGYKAYEYCKDCDYSTFEEVSSNGHSFTNYVSNNDATCKENGTETATCDNCNATDTRVVENSKADHKYETYVSNNDATCQKNATETAECEYGCGETDTRDIENSKADHKYETYVSNNDATCQKNATETAECEYGCGETDTRDIENSKADHKYETYVSNNDATCQKNATETAECAYGCGETDTRDIENSKADHDYGEASCDEPAKCTKCGAETGEALGHNEVVVPGKAATCTEPGLTDGKKCSRCGETLEAQTEIPASGKHTYCDPVPTKAPSANEPGEYTETCTACGDTVITKVFFADYSKLNEVTEQLNRLLNNNTDLTDEAEQILNDAIAEAEGIDKNLVADVTTAGGKEIKGGQDTIDALVAKLNKVEDEITDAIHDGSALVPDYSAWDAAVADYNKVDKTRVMQKYLDEAAALMAEIAEKKADTTHTQASATQAEINAATKRLNEITYNIKLKSYVAPDFSALENAIAEYNGLDVSTEVLNSVDREMTEIKNAYADIKGDTEANEYAHQLQLDTLEARVKTILAGIADTSLIKPDYSSATASLNTVKALAEANKLLDGVAKSISDAEAKLNKIIGNASSNMKADQQAVDAVDAELKALIKDITDGKLVKPDYSAADEAIANTDKVSILTDEEKATIEGLKEILDGIKSNAASNKYDDQLTVDSVASQIGAIYSKYEDCLPDNHDYVVTVVDPKCGVDGYTDHTCSKCGYNYKDNFVTATTQHDWDEGVLTRPTATTDGYYTYTCMNPACGATKTEKVERADYGKYNEAVSELNDLINSVKLTDKAKAEAEAALNDAKITDGYITSEQGYVDAATTVIESIYAAVGNDEANFKPDFSEVNGLLDKYVEISSKVEIPEDVKSEINKIIEEIYAIIDDSSSNKKDHQSVVDGLADTLKNLIAVYEDCANGIHRDNDDDTLCDHCGQEYIKGADGCFCHKDNLISKIVRLIYSCISWLFGKKISCCPDMEFYFKGIGSLT